MALVAQYTRNGLDRQGRLKNMRPLRGVNSSSCGQIIEALNTLSSQNSGGQQAT